MDEIEEKKSMNFGIRLLSAGIFLFGFFIFFIFIMPSSISFVKTEFLETFQPINITIINKQVSNGFGEKIYSVTDSDGNNYIFENDDKSIIFSYIDIGKNYSCIKDNVMSNPNRFVIYNCKRDLGD